MNIHNNCMNEMLSKYITLRCIKSCRGFYSMSGELSNRRHDCKPTFADLISYSFEMVYALLSRILSSKRPLCSGLIQPGIFPNKSKNET